MPATSKKQIYNFEGPFQRAFEGVMNAAGYGQTFVERSMETLPPSRIEVMFSAGAAINQETLADGSHVYDFYDGSLVVRIVTERPSNSPSLIDGVKDLHEEWAAAVRASMEERLTPFNATNLPYYSVQTIRPLATTRDLYPRWLEDFTRLEFFVQFGIRSYEWPA